MIKIILVTIPSEKAEALAEKLLQAKLIACANIVPAIKSMYWWEGKIQKDGEALMIMKTPQEKVETLLEFIPEHHPYSVPEILVIDVEKGHPPYLDWVLAETKALPKD